MVNYDDIEEQQFYMEQLMDNYKNPTNVGTIEDYTFLRHQKNASCGDTFDMYVKLNNQNQIEDVKYKGEGCAISTASMSLLSKKLIGMDFEEAKKLIDEDVYELIGVKISPGRINCAMLSINAFKAGAEEYENSKNK